MFFKALPLLLFAGSVQADTVQWQFQATPDHCVTLEQGRLCYATVTVSWQAPAPADVCLQLDQQQLHCWQQQSQGQWQFEFAGSESAWLQLHSAGQLVGEKRLLVSWVQKNRPKKRYWRLF